MSRSKDIASKPAISCTYARKMRSIGGKLSLLKCSTEAVNPRRETSKRTQIGLNTAMQNTQSQHDWRANISIHLACYILYGGTCDDAEV